MLTNLDVNFKKTERKKEKSLGRGGWMNHTFCAPACPCCVMLCRVSWCSPGVRVSSGSVSRIVAPVQNRAEAEPTSLM